MSTASLRCATGCLLVASVPVMRAVPARAQGTGAEVPVVLATPASVRSAGMQGSGAALVGYPGAVFSNPAGLATIRHIGLEGAFRRIPTDGYLAVGALAWRMRQFDLGVGVGYLDFGAAPSTLLGAGGPPAVNAREVVAVGSLVYRFGLIAFGGSGKYVRRTVDADIQRAVSADAGLAIAFFDIMAIGFSLQNLGGNWQNNSTLALPHLTRFGFTMNYVDPQETVRLMSNLEVQWREREDARWVIGGEAGLVVEGVGLIARAAYGSQAAPRDRSTFTYGGSLSIGKLQLDYAYQPADLLGEEAHRFGLRLAL